MKVITVDGQTYDVKYLQNKENITNDFGTVVLNYPDFIGSKLPQNSSSSDRYSLNFAIHLTLFVSFKESVKKFVTNEADAVDHSVYGKLTNIIIEHDLFGAIKGKIVGSISYDTSKGGDILCSCVFQEETPDTPIEKRDIEIENETAFNDVDLETTSNFDVSLSALDVSTISNFGDNLKTLYNNIQNSAIVQAFNDFNSAITAAVIESKKVMNTTKAILSLPLSIFTSTKDKLELLQAQAEEIKKVPINSFNIAKFNINTFTFNVAATSRTVYISEAALQAAAGIKTVPL